MQAIFDHLIAIIVGSVVILALIYVQHQSQKTSVEATERYVTETQTDEFARTLERDLENIRTVAQTEHAFGMHRFALRRATGSDGNQFTRQLSFPTLASPDLGNASPVMIVTYLVEPTGSSSRVGEQLRPLYKVTRYTYLRGGTSVRTGGAEKLIDFDIVSIDRRGVESNNNAYISETPVRVDVDIEASASSTPVENRTSQLRATRVSRTVRVLNALATGGLPPVDTSLPPGIPNLPGDPPPAPPSIPEPGGSGEPGTGGQGSGGQPSPPTGGGGTPVTPRGGPTTPPAPAPPPETRDLSNL